MCKYYSDDHDQDGGGDLVGDAVDDDENYKTKKLDDNIIQLNWRIPLLMIMSQDSGPGCR